MDKEQIKWFIQVFIMTFILSMLFSYINTNFSNWNRNIF